MKKLIVAYVAFATATTFAGAASAQEVLGEAGQIAISGDLQLQVSQTKQKPPEGDAPDAETTIRIVPALDYFVVEGVSVGFTVAYLWQKQGDTKASGLGIGPSVGYALPLGEKLAFWPKLGIAYLKVNAEDGEESLSGSKLMIDLFAPLAIQPAEHFFIGIGPGFSTDLSSKMEGEDANKSTTVGVGSQVGGYF